MKKYFAFALAAATLLVSCQKENNVTEITPEPEFLTVTIQKDPETRTYIESDNCVYWNEDLSDRVWFANDNGEEIALCPVSVNNNHNSQKSSATFKIPIGQDFSFPRVLYAAYPAPRGSVYPYSVDNGNITFKIPEIQTGSFAGANICVAKTKIGNSREIDLYFRNVTAILRFTRGSNPATSLEIKNSTYSISGQFTAELGFDDNGYGTISNVLPPSVSGANDGKITITPGNNNDTYYYVTVGPCTMNSSTSFIWTEGGVETIVPLQNSTDLKYNRIYKLGEFNSNGGSTSGDEYYFTINSSGKKVVLAPGNLWKQPTRPMYGLNDHQYDNISATAFYTNQKRDKFNWGEELKTNKPPRTWDINNKTWYALYDDEWLYIFSRDNYSKVGLGQIMISQGDSRYRTYYGLFILPDNFTDPNANIGNTSTSFVPNIIDHTNNYLTATDEWQNNKYNDAGWAKMEANGVVFLPATGYGHEDWASDYVDEILNTTLGYYWTQSDPASTSQQHWGHFFFTPIMGSIVVNVNDAWMNIRPARDYVSKGNTGKTTE